MKSLSTLLRCLGLLIGVSTSNGMGAEFSFDLVVGVFAEHCVECHNDSDQQGDFSLQTRQSYQSRGFHSDDLSDHPLLIAIDGDGQQSATMPKDRDRLSNQDIEIIRRWIASGSSWPNGITVEVPEADFDWWSLKPIRAPQVPRLKSDWIRNPIDAFALEQLNQLGLTPNDDGDRLALLRRVSYDLIGLPPTPDQVDRFLGDTSPVAYENLVDRLLASPDYGQRWARHWLDVVKYADTCGYDKDKLRPHAWPYRDYVIRSFNTDKPYHRFVQEQIAGDVLFPDDRDGILGLGFIAAGPWDFIGHVEVSEQKMDGKVARNLDRDEMVSNTFNSFCSITVQCARCHDHKFDPFTQEHYYGLQAIFAGVDRADRVYAPGQMVYAAATDFEANGNFKPTSGVPRAIHLLRRGDVGQPGEAVGPGRLPLSSDDDWKLPPELPEADRRAALARWISDRDNPLVWRSIVNRIWQYHFGQGLVSTPNDFGRMGSKPTNRKLLEYLATRFRDESQSIKKLHRLIVTSSLYRQSSHFDQADAAVDGSNRYLWRMNRRRLSAEEIRDSLLHISDVLNRQMDGPGFYLFELEKTEHSPHFEYHKFDPSDSKSHRRSIYRFVVRSQPNPYMTVLDCADSSQSTPRRIETLTSLQALTLLNNRFQLEMAEQFATRLRKITAQPGDQIDQAMRILVGRRSTVDEHRDMLVYLEQHGLENLCRVLFNFSEFIYLD